MRNCILRCGSPALPHLDLCLSCSHAELAKRGRKRKRKAPPSKLPTVSINSRKYAAMKREAARRGWTLRQLTKREREQVVELLRCAADGLSPTSTGAWTRATALFSFRVETLAAEAYWSVAGLLKQFSQWDCEQGRAAYLEAAQRVEEGWEP